MIRRIRYRILRDFLIVWILWWYSAIKYNLNIIWVLLSEDKVIFVFFWFNVLTNYFGPVCSRLLWYWSHTTASRKSSWGCHDMETFSKLMALCERKTQVTGARCWRFELPWRLCDIILMLTLVVFWHTETNSKFTHVRCKHDCFISFCDSRQKSACLSSSQFHGKYSPCFPKLGYKVIV